MFNSVGGSLDVLGSSHMMIC